jgi:hypothetical protein
MLKLVYGCLAFSLIAGAIIFVSAAGQGNGFRGMTKSMGDAISQNAAVLDADRNGAVTQTGNGRITGYKRDLTKAWSTEFDPFEEGPNNPYGAGTIKAFAWCTEGCPNAILDINRKFTSHGSAGEGLASTMTSLGLNEKSVLSIYALNAAFVATNSADQDQTELRYVVHQDSSVLPISNPSTVSVDDPAMATHAIVGSARGRTGFLTRMTKGETWEIKAPRIRETDLKNACISADGGSIGLVSTRVKRSDFFDSPGDAIGPKLASGACTVDANGITAMYTPAKNPSSLEAARYSNDGRRLWHRTFGAQRLLSRSGWRDVVTQAPNGKVTAIDSVSGRTVFAKQVTGVPFAAEDGSIVTAGRDGEPRWLLVGGLPQSQ